MTSDRKYKVGYKIVRKRRGSLHSFLMSINQVVYEQGRWTRRKPGWGPMAVFPSLEITKYWVANQFRYASSADDNDHDFLASLLKSYEIRKCVYLESREHALYMIDEKGRKEKFTSLIPEGTQFADEILLSEEVEFDAYELFKNY